MKTDALSLNTTQAPNSDNSISLSRLPTNKITQGAAACSNRIPDFSKLNHQPLNLVEATKLCYPESEFKPIPKQIHMIWVASVPQEKQIKYVRDWAKKNPQAAINLWVDSRHFDTYQKNKSANTAARITIAPLGAELQLRNLSQQLIVSQNNDEALTLSIFELNKALKGECKAFRGQVLGRYELVTKSNYKEIIFRLNKLLEKNKEKFLEADAKMLSHTVQSWDQYKGGLNRDVKRLEEVRSDLERSGLCNIHVKDLSNSEDIKLENEEAYQHEMIGRGGAYPAASDIARYEILNQHGGIYTDVDLECKQTLAFDRLKSHPDLVLVGMAASKKEETGSVTPYFANALIASHQGSQLIGDLIGEIKEEYDSIKGNDFSGTRYFARPNKATIERTGPNKLREQVSVTLNRPLTDINSKSMRIWDKAQQINSDIWQAIDSHFTFPEGLIEFETPEQAESATKAMSEPA
ncbi:TcdA/TcdB catalytic glycosyltransferase domain-containing protein [Vibrio hyugaensis]|uniref:TcdA/TcdB catalytic glycosyltransferase domain-containing protein n=1 Tax=Vibrio hyugaensis TaxID=1534743 RepID=UPI0005F07FD0|nr:TcdA/TcdB catalytic glycosyltransferase domain-containing protein [Vibrio hyugaensis]